MNLHDAVRAAFAPEGVLARTVDEFRPRSGQTEMALAVADAIAERGVLVAEAGTGVGKTYAYLVPALLSGERVLLSTATKTLQDQLYGRDLPRLIEALGLPRAHGPAQGTRQLSLSASHGTGPAGRRDECATGRARPGARGALGAADAQRRSGRAAGTGRALAGDPAGDFHARQLPGQQLPALSRLPRQPGAARGAGGRRGGHQPPSVLCRSGGARIGHGRAAAQRAHRDLRRGPPAQRDRRAVSRPAALHRPGAGLLPRPAGLRPAAGARPGRLDAAGHRRGARRTRSAPVRRAGAGGRAAACLGRGCARAHRSLGLDPGAGGPAARLRRGRCRTRPCQ